MVCFLEESPLDYLVYYPIIKTLTDQKKEYISYNTAGKTTVEMLHFLGQNPSIKRIVSYGGSQHKLAISLLCKEYGLEYINLHGEERDENDNGMSFSDGISKLAYRNYVVSDPARGFLISQGIQTPVGIFECPITNLARRQTPTQTMDVLIISGKKETIQKLNEQFSQHKWKFGIFDYSDGLPENWKSIYTQLNSTKMLVSDAFIFDKPSRFLNKHMFYTGNQILDTANLGISTHTISKKLELHDYLKQTWSNLQDINPRHGLQSLLQIL